MAPTPTPINLSDTNPAAATGKRNVNFQASAPYSFVVNINGVNVTVQVRDVSAQFPNVGGVDARTTTTETIALASQGKLVTLTNSGAMAVTLNSAAVASGFFCAVINEGTGAATLTPSSGTIDLAANLLLLKGQGIWLFFDGTNWETDGVGFSNPMTTLGDIIYEDATPTPVRLAGNTTATKSWLSQTGTGSISAVPSWDSTVGQFVAGITIDGGGSVPSTGSKGYIQIPVGCKVLSWTLLADQSGSAQITVKKSTYSGFPTTSSIVASAPPKLVLVQKNTDSTLSGWTTTITAGDILEFNLDSVTTCQRLNLTLVLQRT